MAKNYSPWRDRTGRFSVLRTMTLAVAVSPAIWLAAETLEGWLGPEPWTESLHQSGTWAVRFLLLSLAITPLRRIWQWGPLIAVRRMVGLTALAYAALHLVLYVGQQHGDLAHVADEIARRFYLAIGFAALIGLAILGVTSTDGMIHRIGGKRWQALHRVVYTVGLLALCHFMLQAKLDIAQPVLMLGLFLYLMGWRLVQTRRLGDSVPALLGLAAASALGTALAEAGWYGLVHHRPIADVLAANMSVDDGPSAAVVLLAVGLVIAASRLGRTVVARPATPAPRRPRLTRNAVVVGD